MEAAKKPLSLDKFLEIYPFQGKALALLAGIPYSTFTKLRDGKLSVTPERRQEHFDKLQTELVKIADEITKVRFM